nr:transketolase C-terminal domain-containing protein [Gordonia sp. (in: high G+C Gram-positive bacteria)]
REEFAEAIATADGPTAVRFSKGAVPEDIRSVERVSDGVDVLRRGMPGAGAVRGDVLIVAVGAFCSLALDAADRLAQQGIAASVIDPRWVLPVPDSVVDLARAHRLVVTLEDGGISGGVGSAVAAVVADADVLVPVQQRGIPQEFIEMGSRGEILADLGLTAQDLARSITATVSRMQSVPELGDDALAEAPADQPADSHADD